MTPWVQSIYGTSVKREAGERPELCPQLYVPQEFTENAIVLMDEKARKWNESEDLPQSSQIRRLGVKHP